MTHTVFVPGSIMADPMPADQLQPMPPVPFPDRARPGPRLPVPLTSFIGRQREIDAIVALLRDGARLVTLTGPGGVGKTRLALEVARELAGTHPNGVTFVDLAPLTDPSLILPAIAQALGIRETGDQLPVQRLAAVLRDQELLLILDNFEHLIDAALLVTDLLTACPRLTVLVTSRARLHLSAERIFPVAPLQLPSTDHPADAGGEASEAVRLFVARAQQVNPAFALSETNLAAVVEICHRLDGLPLAIELAAARADLLPPSALLARLDKRLPFLTTGARDQPVRLQTMLQAIAWSHDLLSDTERVLFRRLAVFAGGCTLEAGERVSGEGGKDGAGKGVSGEAGEASFSLPAYPLTPSPAVLDGITFLVDKSLLRQVPEDDGEPRLVMLETVREFGLERLAEAGEETATRDRHAAWYRSLAEQAHHELVRADQRRWVERLDREHANVRAALTWLIDRGETASALRLAGDMFLFWFLRGHLREGYAWLEQILARAPDAEPADRAWATFAAGLLVWAQGDFPQAEALARQGLAIAEPHDLAFGMATCTYLLHNINLVQGKIEEAVAIGEQVLTHMRESGNQPWLAYGLCDVGTAIALNGDRVRGRSLIEEGLALHRELGNKQGAGNHLSDMGFDALNEGDLLAATRQFDESVRLHWEGGDRWYLASPVVGLAAVAVQSGQAGAAARLIGASSAIRELSGAPLWPDEQAHYERTVTAAREALGDDAYEREERSGRVLPLDAVVEEARTVASVLLDDTAPARPQPLAAGGLTARELEVLRLLAAGKSNLEIADVLFVSRGTIRTHVSNILGKLDAKTRTEASAIAHREGLI